MKIYYASQSFYPHIGGVSTYLLNLCKEMVKRENDVIEVHLRPAGEKSYEEIEGIRVHRVPKEPIDSELMQKYSQFKESVYKGSHYNTGNETQNIEDWEGYNAFYKINEFFGEEIRTLLEGEPADIVHIHDFQLLYAYKYVPRGTPLILTWHIPFVANMNPTLKEFLVRNLNEYDKIVFSSQEYIDEAIKAGVHKEKIELIHPIANTDIFKKIAVNKEKIYERYNIPKDAKTVISVQRVDPKSGHEQLIKAFAHVKKEVPQAKLIFVGGESMSNKLSKSRNKLRTDIDELIAKLNLENDVIFTGTIPYEHLPEVYNAMDVNALCSKNEGFGLAITEGMACGKPIIGTNVGGIPIQVKDGRNGFLVNVGDEKKTAEKICLLLKDDELTKKMGEESLKVVEEEFSINVGIEKHSALYTKIETQKDEHSKLEFRKKETISGIITDLDRTITDEAGKVEFDADDFDKKLLNELKKTNIPLFLATGRRLKYVKDAAKKFKIWDAIISENGAVIYFPNDNKTLTISTYHMRKAKKMLRALNLPGTTTGKIIVSADIKYEDEIKKHLGSLVDKLEFTPNVNEIMILPKGVRKGIGILLALRYLNIDVDNTICIGDGENDIDMFLNPGFKVAVANAHPKLKELAHYVTKGKSTQGVREVIQKINQS